jgi:hypothetical protein
MLSATQRAMYLGAHIITAAAAAAAAAAHEVSQSHMLCQGLGHTKLQLAITPARTAHPAVGHCPIYSLELPILLHVRHLVRTTSTCLSLKWTMPENPFLVSDSLELPILLHVGHLVSAQHHVHLLLSLGHLVGVLDQQVQRPRKRTACNKIVYVVTVVSPAETG